MHKTHGMSGTPEYVAWNQLKARCCDPKHRYYPEYGGRGIQVDPAWINDFMAFYGEVGPRPSSKHSIDRINNDLGYVKGNLRWATQKEQCNNRRPHRTRRPKEVVEAERAARKADRVTSTTHGRSETPEYAAWAAMKDHCLNPKSLAYPIYGGAGVKVHGSWIHDFTAFYHDLGDRPSSNHQLTRYPDPYGDYVPGNTRWVAPGETPHVYRPTLNGPEHGNATHYLTKSPEYKLWIGIKTRCFNVKSDKYAEYGARGITMCARWKNDFKAFFGDVGSKSLDRDMVLHRIDHDKGYSCGKCDDCKTHGWGPNCEWASKTEVNRARRASGHSGKLNEQKVAEIRRKLKEGAHQGHLAEEYGVNYSVIGKIKRGQIWA